MADSQDRFYSGLAIGALLGGLAGGLMGYLLSAPSSEAEPLRSNAAKRIRRASKNRRSDGTSATANAQDVLEEVQQSADQVISDARQSINVKIAQLNEAIEQARGKLGTSNHTKIEEEPSSPGEML
jgi:gas vesicle protein